MKKLVIAEKPNLGRNIMYALMTEGEKFKEGKEYSESQNYIITSAFGHLFSLKEFEDYEPDKDMWDINNLPYFPEKYEFKLIHDKKTKSVDKGVQKRFQTICSLLERKDVDEVLHCGDSDREGQIIIDIILKYANNKKKVTRPQIKDMTEKTIINAIKNREENSNFQNTFREGMIRMFVDFDYGINLSRYANAKTGAYPALNIGRVIGAMVNAIYERDLKIKNFKPTPYLIIQGNLNKDGEEVLITIKEKYSKDDMQAAIKIAEDLSKYTAEIKRIENKEKKIHSPKLFSQSDLQNKMSKLYKFTPKRTLEAAQGLYEKGFTTYPRTNTEYLSTGEKEEVRKIIEVHNNNDLCFKNIKSIFDDSKVEGHTAIIPTIKDKGIETLSEDEKLTYQVIRDRFRAVFFSEECIESETKIYITVKDIEFVITGSVELQPGWRRVEAVEKKNKMLPKFIEGEILPVKFNVVEKETTPPKHYTIESFNNFLRNPFHNEKMTEDEKYKSLLSGVEIGTEATRADMINKAISKKYIELKKDTYYITEHGMYLAEVMKKLGIDMSKERTTEMAKMTTAISKGEVTVKQVLDKVHKEITEIINADLPIDRVGNPNINKEIGSCPACGGKILNIDNSKMKAYKCDTCQFIIWKNAFGSKITEENAKKLLTEHKSGVMMFKSKSGKTYTGKLLLKDMSGQLEMQFMNGTQKKYNKSKK